MLPPFIDQTSCEEVCIKNNPQWRFFMDDITRYHQFFGIWAQSHVSRKNLNLEITIENISIKTKEDVLKLFEQSICNIRTFDKQVKETMTPTISISKEELENRFSCLGKFTYNERDPMADWFKSIANQSGGNFVSGEDLIKMLQQLEKEKRNVTREDFEKIFGKLQE